MTLRKHIGILGGSFNPVHIGHTLLAEYLVQFTDIDEVWLMLSPQNPLKEVAKSDRASDFDRMAMLEIAARNSRGLKVCGIELTMPRPSYTIDSLSRLASLHPDCDFSLIIGSDNWQIFDKWKEHERLISDFHPIIYPRPDYPVDKDSLPCGVRMTDAPTFLISSTFIRSAIAGGHDMTNFLPWGVYEYIDHYKLYTGTE
ncbi:MAG: nicotinate-nucleotide adenylyltransferase [Paramuribaculum sp.]|nr:nicotinate-nucleotide adenylyltransferase [Paramuribaculum sp.]